MTTTHPLSAGDTVFLAAGHLGGVHGVAWVQVDGQPAFLSVGGGGLILLRDDQGAYLRPILSVPGVLAMAVSPTGTAALLGTMEGAWVLDLAGWSATPVAGPTGWVNAVSWSADGRWGAAGDDGGLWTGGAGEDLVAQIPPGPIPCRAMVDATPAQTLVTLDTMRILRGTRRDGSAAWELEEPIPQPRLLAVAAARVLVVGESAGAAVLDAATGEILLRFDCPEGVTAVIADGEGWVTAHRDAQLRRWTAEGTLTEAIQTRHRSWIRCITPGPAGLDSGGDRSQARIAGKMHGSTKDGVLAAGIDPGLKRLAVVTWNQLALWDLETCARHAQAATTQRMTAAAPLADGGLLAADQNGGLHLFTADLEPQRTGQASVEGEIIALAQRGDQVFARTKVGHDWSVDLASLTTAGPLTSGADGAPWLRKTGRWFSPGRALKVAFLRGEAMVIVTEDQVRFSPAAASVIRLGRGATVRTLP